MGGHCYTKQQDRVRPRVSGWGHNPSRGKGATARDAAQHPRATANWLQAVHPLLLYPHHSTTTTRGTKWTADEGVPLLANVEEVLSST